MSGSDRRTSTIVFAAETAEEAEGRKYGGIGAVERPRNMWLWRWRRARLEWRRTPLDGQSPISSRRSVMHWISFVEGKGRVVLLTEVLIPSFYPAVDLAVEGIDMFGEILR